jgi:hypothetical protein
MGFWLSATLTNLAPVVEQISIKETPEPFAIAKAWEIDGTSDASRIAKQAIHVANCRVDFFIPIAEFYHAKTLVTKFMQNLSAHAHSCKNGYLLHHIKAQSLIFHVKPGRLLEIPSSFPYAVDHLQHVRSLWFQWMYGANSFEYAGYSCRRALHLQIFEAWL